jgi:hypothetical protein
LSRPGPRARITAQARLRDQAATLRATILHEVQALRPMGTVTPFMAAMARPQRGVVASTPIGIFLFVKDRQPTPLDLADWSELERQAHELEEQAVVFSWGLEERPNTTTGNYRVVETGRALQQRNMLSPRELAALDRLDAFWTANPDAACGVYGKGRVITPLQLYDAWLQRQELPAVPRAAQGGLHTRRGRPDCESPARARQGAGVRVRRVPRAERRRQGLGLPDADRRALREVVRPPPPGSVRQRGGVN